MPTTRYSLYSIVRSSAPANRLLYLLFLAAVSLASVAHGQEQQYRSDPVDPKARSLGGVVATALRNPSIYTAEKAKFDEYFDKYYFPDMTSTADENLARLGDLRYNLFKRFLWSTNNEQLQRDLTEKAYAAMGRIVGAQNPPYHPAVRYNAILIIGMLDRQYAADGANARPPEPLPQATRVLTAVVDMATTSTRFTPPVILGALIGLERHAQLRQSLAADDVTKMTAALLKLVAHEQPIQEMDRSAYAWLRLRAAGVLAQLGSVGTNNVVHDALVKLIGDLRSLDDRCAAAALLTKLNYDEVKLPDSASIEPLFTLARDLGTAEAKRAKEFQEAEIGGGFIPGRGESFLPMGGLEQQERFPRRHVLARLTDLRTGLRAVKPAVPEDAQTKIDAVIAAINPVIVAAIDKNVVELRFTAAVTTMAEAIEVAAAPAEAPAAEDEVQPDF